MVRWLEPQKETEPPDRLLMGSVKVPISQGEITDDPLACLDGMPQNEHQIYSVTRSVMLPRLSINKSTSDGVPQFSFSGGGVNPLFKENMMFADTNKKIRRSSFINRQAQHDFHQSGEKSGSSGYGSSRVSSNLDCFNDRDRALKNSEEVPVVERNSNFVKSIKICRRKGMSNFVPSSGSGSSSGTLNAIPEGKVDPTRPKVIWPEDDERRLENYDSIVDDALLFYTSLSYIPEIERNSLDIQLSVTELLVDILKNINSTLDGHTEHTPEDVLKLVTNKINLGLEVLRNSTEEDMKKLCLNLRNCKKVNSVIRAFSNYNSSSGSGDWSSGKPRSSSSDTEDFYRSHFSTPSSSFSESVKGHSDSPVNYDRTDNRENLAETATHKVSALRANDEKPSVWEQYYGVKAEPALEVPHVVPKPTDVPIFVSNIFLIITVKYRSCLVHEVRI
ncbi:hypothetical protein HHI36_000216 [Cryptolaemus montrouzieri]|uniref:Uncharacterized protein n=1 Tax=Cryptolaemus montrouzieri TaxID=559131 RepID=A0ABD2P4K2_9CUCU